MARRTDLSNNIVTAGKFIERGGRSVSITEKLSRLSTIMNSANNNVSKNEIMKITSDNIITPLEKQSLKTEWDYIKSGFSSITSTISSMGQLNSEEYNDLKISYDNLEAIMESILADMNKSTELAEPIDRYLNDYSQNANMLNIYLASVNNSILEEASQIGLVVESNYNYIKPNQSVVFTAFIYSYKTGGPVEISDEVKELYKDPETGLYPKLYQWSISGTKNDEQWNSNALGRRQITIPYSDFEDSQISASFICELSVG